MERLSWSTWIALAVALAACADDASGGGTDGDDDASTTGSDPTGGQSAEGGGAPSAGGGSPASGSGGAGASAGNGGAGGAPDPGCDPLGPGCVACGTETCGGGAACCGGDAPSCGPVASCMGPTSATCDGHEDCPGTCCVDLNAPDGSLLFGSAACDSTCDEYHSGQLVAGYACRTAGDCSAASNTYDRCCHLVGFDVGVCTTEAAATLVASAGGSCE